MPPARSSRSTKTVLGSISAVAMFACLSFASPALAEETYQVSYSVDGGQVTITGCNGDCPSNLAIPSTIEGKPVVAIADEAFANQEAITSVTIPEGVTSIGANAFGGANGLTSVPIPSTVTSLGNAAFQSMNALATVTFAAGSNLATISSDCFRSDGQLKNVVLPATVTSIEHAAFLDDGSLTSLTFQGDAPTIGDDAFWNVSALAQLASKTLTGFGLNGDDFHGLTVAGGYSRPGTPGSFSAEATLTSNPSTTTVDFTLAEAGGTVQCRVNDGAWGDCTSIDGTAGKFTVSNLTGGGQSISVRQTNSDNITSHDGTVYLAPTLIGAPVGLLTNHGVQFQVAHASNGELSCDIRTPNATAQGRCADLPSWFLPNVRITITHGEPTNGVTTDTVTTCSPSCGYDGTYDLRFKQEIDGKTSLVSQATWTQDTTGPDQPGLTGQPDAFTTSRSASFGFTSTEANETFECSVDGGAYSACTSPKSISSLADGPHSLAVRGVDSLGNSGSASTATWTVDTTPPAAPSVASPANSGVSLATAPFTVTGEAGAKFLCSLDGGSFVKCPRASGAPGDQSALTVGWNTKLHWGESADWSKLKLGFSYPGGSYIGWYQESARADLPDGVTLAALWLSTGLGDYYGNTCEAFNESFGANGYGFAAGVPNGNSSPTVFNAFSADCSDTSTEVPPGSPAQFTSLSEGNHTLSVKQVDKVGNESQVATSSWTVDTTAPSAPVLTGAPSPSTNRTSASIGFSGEPYASFTCSVDGGAYSTCGSSPKTLSGLAQGPHSLKVKQTDRAGNTSAAATASWTVDTTPPVAPRVRVNRSAVTNLRWADVSFTGEPSAHFQCKLDGGWWVDCVSAKRLTYLPWGQHVVKVRQSDAAGNVSPTASVSWTTSKLTLVSPAQLSGGGSSLVRVGATISASGFDYSGQSSGDGHLVAQWQRCVGATANSCSNIQGATQSTYVATAADAGKRLRFATWFSSSDGVSVNGSTELSRVVVPVATSVPRISIADSLGAPALGRKLSVTGPQWVGLPGNQQVSYRWQRCSSSSDTSCRLIGGDVATHATYTVDRFDVAHRIRALVGVTVGVRYNKMTVWVPSDLSGVATTTGKNTALPTMSFVGALTAPKVASPVTVSTGTWAYTWLGGYSYQWQACTSAEPASCSTISGESRAIYVPAGDLVGKRLRAVVTYTGHDASSTKVSAATAISAPVTA